MISFHPVIDTGRMRFYLTSQTDFDTQQHGMCDLIGRSRHSRGNFFLNKRNTCFFIIKFEKKFNIILTIDIEGDPFADDWRNVVGCNTQINGHHLAGYSIQSQFLSSFIVHFCFCKKENRFRSLDSQKWIGTVKYLGLFPRCWKLNSAVNYLNLRLY